MTIAPIMAAVTCIAALTGCDQRGRSPANDAAADYRGNAALAEEMARDARTTERSLEDQADALREAAENVQDAEAR